MSGWLSGRKSIRLPADVYQQPGIRALLTIVVNSRDRIFENAALALEIVELLRQQAEYERIAVLAYCLMPDHLHLLVRVDGPIGAVQFIQTFKSKSTRIAWKHGHTGQLWQRSFHDRLLRETENEHETIRYLLANPVRSGLVGTWPQYAFSGLFAYELADFS